ncbi:hypothetical protein C4D60_Mb11t12640 [Musa balbisiana]|uniref:RRM domain-containing protein n=1 Tax=Musa balbisiana TaxID=52838 RepID=A0A4S8J4J0_MUSBA|nr:hypothetical protein C4D60_Mb11t12640 [Musa balbisiana]
MIPPHVIITNPLSISDYKLALPQGIKQFPRSSASPLRPFLAFWTSPRVSFFRPPPLQKGDLDPGALRGVMGFLCLDIRNKCMNIYQGVFEELSKFGKIESLNVCDNLADHSVGNVYAKFRDEDDAANILVNLNGRY